MYQFSYGFGIRNFTLLNLLPIVPNGTATSVSDVTDTGFKVLSSVETTTNTVVTLEYGTETGVYTAFVTAAESPLLTTGDVNFILTGLSPYTDYFFRIKAVNSAGTAYSVEYLQKTEFYATLTATGNGTGVSTLRFEVSENQTIEIKSGTARFYTDAAGTLNESTTWAVTTGALITIYLKAPSGSSILNIPKPDKIIKFGNPTVSQGWVSSTNAAKLKISQNKFSTCTMLFIAGNCEIIDNFHASLLQIRLDGSVTYNTSVPLPINLNYINIDSSSVNITLLDFSGTGNYTVFDLRNFRTNKLSDSEIIALLTSLTNRLGAMPASIRIGDYLNYGSPPQSVTDAVNVLKLAKAITTVTLAI